MVRLVTTTRIVVESKSGQGMQLREHNMSLGIAVRLDGLYHTGSSTAAYLCWIGWIGNLWEIVS